MTRVLMTADAVGGVWPYALELADAMTGVEVHLAVMGPAPSAEQRRAAERAAIASLTCGGFALEWMPRPWADVDAAGAWLLDLAERLGPDIVHVNGYAHAALGWPVPVVVVAHSDVLSWWRAVHGEPAPPQWRTYRDRVTAGLTAADVVVAPTRAVLGDLAREYGVVDGVVVPNGRRADWVRPVAKEPLVLGAGRAWDEAKNLGTLARIALPEPWRLAVAGDGEAPRFLGSMPFERLARWLLRAAIFAAPARYEPFGLAVLEAALAGCALVLGDVASLREVWGDAAVYVPDEPSLAAALRELAGRPDRVADLARRARCRAERYTPRRMASGYLDVYRRVAVPV
jgi:glycosyltransferase involved in cell wall biosynthesis